MMGNRQPLEREGVGSELRYSGSETLGGNKLGTLAAEQEAGSPGLSEHNVWFVTGRGGEYVGSAGQSLASRVRGTGY